MPGLPDVHPRPGLPTAVTVYEVGPRDGLQAEATIVPVAVKLELIDRLGDAGLTAIEATSFVAPSWVPQLADAEEVMAGLQRRPGVRYPVLTPNRRGFDRAVAAGADEVAVFVSATETFAQRNLNTTLDGAIAMAGPVIDAARNDGLRVRGYVSMAFGDPWEGRVDPERTAAVTARLFALGCATVSLGDTIGVATPGQVQVVLQTVAAAGVPLAQVALHLHDTYGQALANVLAGLEAGVTEFDASAGGVGGCPFAQSATGNLATEDLVWMLDGLGIEHGLDLTALVRTSAGWPSTSAAPRRPGWWPRWPRRSCPSGVRVPSDERHQPGLHVGVVRHRDPRPVLAAGPQQLVDRLHAGQQLGAERRVQGLVLPGGPGQVPGVHEHVGGVELRHRRAERELAGVRVAQHPIRRSPGPPATPAPGRCGSARPRPGPRRPTVRARG